MRKVGLAKTVSTLEYEKVLEPTRTVNSCEQPAEHIVTLYIRSVESEFRPLGLNLILRDHWMPVRSKSAARYLL